MRLNTPGAPVTATAGRGLPVGRITVLPNKVMKETKPAQAMELRSLSPVFCGLVMWNDRAWSAECAGW